MFPEGLDVRQAALQLPKYTPWQIRALWRGGPQEGRASEALPGVTVFSCSHPQLTAPQHPPSLGLKNIHIFLQLPALVSIATKQKPTGFVKAAVLTATREKGKENSLGNFALTLEICP